ncbi:MAG: FAD-dependent oxidoreductase [Bdellovibrionales bacterium]|nr:FAD-dependent oxidoreductase [Bdellovibrionales bacterium]
MSCDASRRQVLKLISAGGLTLFVESACAPLQSNRFRHAAHFLDTSSPIDRSLPDVAAPEYSGDSFDRPHSILWNKAGYLANHPLPQVSEEVPLVIVGGGIAGLATAYLLRDYNPLLIEQAPRFGGNSKGQSWRGIDYSIGAAYFVEPEEDSDIAKFLDELGILQRVRIKQEEDPVAISHSIHKEFWQADSLPGLDRNGKHQLELLKSYFEKIFAAEESPYPDIPIVDHSTRAWIEKLDRENFAAHLERVAGGKLAPLIETAIEHYCWSSFGGSAREISAAAGLNFYCAEFGSIAVAAGGNSFVAERILEQLQNNLPHANFRTSSLVYDVRSTRDGVNLTYVDALGKDHTISANTAVLACPKFIAAKILDGIEPERLAAIQRLRYRSYLVANVCLETSSKDPFYDLYLLGDGRVDSSDVTAASNRRGVTDVVMANYAAINPRHTVLTLYRGLPYDGARLELFDPSSYAKVRTKFEEQIHGEILPLLKLSSKEVVDLRVARWGHPLPLAAPGILAEGVYQQLRKPVDEKIFFVEQDNWALPAFETALTEAILWAPRIRESLEASGVWIRT